MMKIGVCLIVALLWSVPAWSGEIKSSFESGDFSGWNTQGEGWSIYVKAASEGKKCAHLKINKGEAAGLKAAVKLIPNADAGSVIKGRLDLAGKVKGGGSTFTASIVCVDAGGQILREVKKKLSAPDAEFRRLSLPELIVPSGTTETYLMLVVELSQPAKSNEWWRFDNVVVDVK